jgi:hypothetical protein
MTRPELLVPVAFPVSCPHGMSFWNGCKKFVCMIIFVCMDIVDPPLLPKLETLGAIPFVILHVVVVTTGSVHFKPCCSPGYGGG